MLDFNWLYDINLIYGGFTVLDGTENQIKTSNSTVFVHQKKVVQINKIRSCNAVDR